MKKIFLFIICVCFCFGLTACGDNKKKKEKVVASIDIIDTDDNIVNNRTVTLERYETYTLNAVLRDIDGNELIVKEKNQQRVIWRCSEPNGITFSPEYPVRGLTTTLYGGVAPITATVTVEYNGIISTFYLSIVMP